MHDIGTTDDDRPFLVLTYADRGTLADRIKAGPLALDRHSGRDRATSARGLQELHDRGVLHRDVKPANVLFRSTPDGERAMLGDLGLGKSLEAVSRVTMPGGTPAYVAPEQVRGDALDPRADLYRWPRSRTPRWPANRRTVRPRWRRSWQSTVRRPRCPRGQSPPRWMRSSGAD